MVDFEGPIFDRDLSSLLEPREGAVLAEGNAVSPPATGSLSERHRPKPNIQTSEIRRDGLYPASNEKTDVTAVYKSWQKGQMAGGEGERQIRRERHPYKS